MALVDDPSVTDQDILLRALLPDWIRPRNGIPGISKQAFLDGNTGEASFFVNGPGVETEVRRIFPGKRIGATTGRAVRQGGFVIARRPEDAAPFTGDPNRHVVIGNVQRAARLPYERCGRCIALHEDTRILPDPQP